MGLDTRPALDPKEPGPFKDFITALKVLIAE